MKIGLLGAGTIGFGVYEIAEKIPDLEITKVLDRRDIPQLRGKLTQDAAEILDDPAIDAVVELLGGVEPAHSWAVRVLEAGKAVVTANKLMLSENLTEMAALSRKTGGKLRFSAAVGGGIPFLFNLLRARRVDEILEVGGILNGTTNYMLDMMQRENLGFEQALKLAQQAGYAEQDPTADVSGGDAKCKIHLSAALAWNGMPDKHDILCEGITSITKQDMEALNKKGYACKLLARAARQDGGISCYVEPTAVPARSVMGNIALVENMAFWRGANAGLQRFTGAGAGRYATAYAVVNDLVDLMRHNDAFPFLAEETPLPIDNAAAAHPYLVRGMEVPGAVEIGDGLLLTGEMPVSEMHAMVASARARGEKVFFAGVCEEQEL